MEVRCGSSAARSLSAEPGGRIVAQVRLSGRVWSDSVSWNGSGASFTFPSLPVQGSYSVKVLVRDASGRTTHSDSAFPVPVFSGASTPISLSLRPVLGRILVSLPSIPSSVDSVSASWKGGSSERHATAPRPGSGKTVLRLDSLPVGAAGHLRLRAWNASGDTLFSCDTDATISSQADLSLSLRWTDASGRISIGGSVQAGGEVAATALFPGQDAPDGCLRLEAFSDSGSSDWIRISNPGDSRLSGVVSVSHGTESVSASLSIPAGGSVVLSRVACGDSSLASHRALSGTDLVCGLPLSVSWNSLPALWELRGPSGNVADRALVEDGKDGWPDLNSGSARTLRRRRGQPGADPMAGRSWCSDGSDLPDASCP